MRRKNLPECIWWRSVENHAKTHPFDFSDPIQVTKQCRINKQTKINKKINSTADCKQISSLFFEWSTNISNKLC